MFKKHSRLVALFLIIGMVVSQAGCSGNDAADSPNNYPNSPNPLPGEAPGAAIGSFAFSMITKGVLEGAVISATEWGVGWLLNFITHGGQNPDDAIREAIDRMQNELLQIQDQLGEMQSELSALLIQANTNTDEIKATIATVNIADQLSTIDVLAKELNSLNVNPDSFAAAVLHPTSGVAFTLGVINDKMVGLAQDGVLDLLVAFLIDKARTNSDSSARFNAYLALEYYFCNVLAIQGQGLNLISEAYHQVKANPASPAAQYLPPGKDPNQALQDYIDKMYKSQIEAQMQKFLSSVEQLVARTADTTATPGMFLPDADRIFMRADFIMEQWRRTTGTAGGHLYVRVVGEPDRLKAYGDSWTSGSPERIVLTATPGWPMGAGNQVPVNTRSYGVRPHYAQWPPLLPTGTFSEAAAVFSAKYGVAMAGPKAVTVRTTYDGSVAASVDYYDDKMKQVAGPTYQLEVVNPDGTTGTRTMESVLFGGCLIPARYDLFSALTWTAHNETIDGGYLFTSSNSEPYARGVFHSSIATGTTPKAIDSSIKGWANGTFTSIRVVIKGDLSTTSNLSFSGDRDTSAAIHASIQASVQEDDEKKIVRHHPPTHYEYWFSTKDAADRQTEQFAVSGGQTSLDDSRILTITKTISKGTALTLEAGYDSEADIRPRTFHSDQYSLLMKVQVSRVWIDFPGP